MSRTHLWKVTVKISSLNTGRYFVTTKKHYALDAIQEVDKAIAKFSKKDPDYFRKAKIVGLEYQGRISN